MTKLVTIYLALAILVGCAGYGAPTPGRSTLTLVSNTTGTTAQASPSPPPAETITDIYHATTMAYAYPGVTISGSSSTGSFNSQYFYYDYGTYNFKAGYGAPGFPTTYPLPRTPACNAALGKLNTDFRDTYMAVFPFLFKFGKNNLPWLAGKIDPAKGGLFYGWWSRIAVLNSDQGNVNVSCRGQGAGMYPNG